MGERGNDFAINTWIFLPNSLDINPATYGKEDFYRDVKSNVRFITPIFPLGEIAGGAAVPLEHIRRALSGLAADPSREHVADYEYHIKMFSAIVKSAMREAVYAVEECGTASVAEELCRKFVADARRTVDAYREAARIIDVPQVGVDLKHLYDFGDEYMSRLTESFRFGFCSLSDGSAATRGRVPLRQPWRSLSARRRITRGHGDMRRSLRTTRRGTVGSCIATTC